MAFKHGLDDDLYSGFDTGGFSRDPNAQSSHLSGLGGRGNLGSVANMGSVGHATLGSLGASRGRAASAASTWPSSGQLARWQRAGRRRRRGRARRRDHGPAEPGLREAHDVSGHGGRPTSRMTSNKGAGFQSRGARGASSRTRRSTH